MGREGGDRRRRRAPFRIRLLRSVRSWHRWASLGLVALVVVSSITGLALAWKKNVDVLQPPTRTGETASLDEWLPVHRLAATASGALAETLDTDDPARLTPERLDLRPGDGIAKVVFPGTWEVQVDGATAEVLSVARRHSDWIEALHDGSILGDGFKLLAMNALGLGLLSLAATGVWVWYGPRRLRREREGGGGSASSLEAFPERARGQAAPAATPRGRLLPGLPGKGRTLLRGHPTPSWKG